MDSEINILRSRLLEYINMLQPFDLERLDSIVEKVCQKELKAYLLSFEYKDSAKLYEYIVIPDENLVISIHYLDSHKLTDKITVLINTELLGTDSVTKQNVHTTKTMTPQKFFFILSYILKAGLI